MNVQFFLLLLNLALDHNRHQNTDSDLHKYWQPEYLSREAFFDHRGNVVTSCYLSVHHAVEMVSKRR